MGLLFIDDFFCFVVPCLFDFVLSCLFVCVFGVVVCYFFELEIVIRDACESAI